jgi:uridine kinase
VIRASIDGFHRPRAARYRRGTDSPEGYYHDSFDYGALRAAILEPLRPHGNRTYGRAVFDYRTDSLVQEPLRVAPADAVLLFDGVFLFYPELNDYWDYRIFVAAHFEIAVARAFARDRARGADATIAAKYRTRYAPGQRTYLEAIRPQERADVVVENDDPANPRLVLGSLHRQGA